VGEVQDDGGVTAAFVIGRGGDFWCKGIVDEDHRGVVGARFIWVEIHMVRGFAGKDWKAVSSFLEECNVDSSEAKKCRTLSMSWER